MQIVLLFILQRDCTEGIRSINNSAPVSQVGCHRLGDSNNVGHSGATGGSLMFHLGSPGPARGTTLWQRAV